jgi:hypothetical protein
MTSRPSLSLFVLLSLSAACKPARPQPRAVQATTPPVSAEVLATVNGAPITRPEVVAAARGPSAHGGSGAAETPPETLERLVQEELRAQRAVSLGLDRDPTFRTDLARAEASLRSWRRTHLATLLETHEQTTRPTVSDAEARAYYEANSPRIRTEVHIAQILLRDEAAITRALAEVRAGAPFEEVARRQFVGLPDSAGHPWDLGFLHWNLLPTTWRGLAYSLPVGQTSEVIPGPNNRFWLINVVARRELPELTFEAMRPAIVTILQEERRLATRTGEREDLRRDARIVYSNNPAP